MRWHGRVRQLEAMVHEGLLVPLLYDGVRVQPML